MIIYSGFADEAGKSINEQIKATKELGWKNIDARFIDGINLTDVDDEKFEEVYSAIKKSNINVACFGSAVANSVKNPLNPEDVEYSFAALERAIPRMKRLGTKYIRGMAFALQKELSIRENEKIVFPLMEKIARICQDAGVVYLCENCGGYAGSSYDALVKLSSHLRCDNFKIVFDTGNPVGAYNRTEEKPYAPQSAWEAYLAMKEQIAYVHIKDQKISDGKTVRTFPGEGEADVVKIVSDLIAGGYDGFFSIEPHMQNGYDGYVEYGKRLEKIVNGPG